MSAYPLSHNSWPTKSALMAGSQSQEQSQASMLNNSWDRKSALMADSQPEDCYQDMLRSSPHSEEATLQPVVSDMDHLSHMPHTKDGAQEEHPQADLGQLISHQSESVEDIASGFQFTPFAQNRPPVFNGHERQTKPAPIPSVQHVKTSTSHATPLSSSHAPRKEPTSKGHLPMVDKPRHTPFQMANPPCQPTKLAGNTNPRHDEIDSGGSTSTLSAVELIQASIEDDGGHILTQDRGSHHDHPIPQIPQRHQLQSSMHSQKPPPTQDPLPSRERRLASHQATRAREVPEFNDDVSVQLANQTDSGDNQLRERPEPDEAPRIQEPSRSIAIPDLTWGLPGPSDQQRRQRDRRNPDSQVTNRPIFNIQSREYSPRPHSRESNVSKRRLPMQSAKFTKPPRKTAPTPLTDKKKSRIESQKGLTKYWNLYFTEDSEYIQRLESKVCELQNQIADCEHDITGYQENITEYQDSFGQLQADTNARIQQLQLETKTQVHTIEQLETHNGQLHKDLGKNREELEKMSSKVKELSKKFHEYKECLNKTMAEHQQLYTKTKRNVKNIAIEFRTEYEDQEKSREASTTKILQESESAREALSKKVESVVREAREHTAELYQKIALLRAELSERQRELVQEKENSENIRRELNESHQATTQALQSLASQNIQILETVEDQLGIEQDALQASEGRDGKLDSLAQALDELRSQLSNPTDIVDKLVSTHQDTREAVQAATEKLESRVINLGQSDQEYGTRIKEIANICRALDERMLSYDGTLHWQAKYQELEIEIQESEAKYQATQAEAHDAFESRDIVFDENMELRNQVAALEGQYEDLWVEMKVGQESHLTETTGLEESLVERDAAIQDLQSKLKESEVNQRNLQQALDTSSEERDRFVADNVGKTSQLAEKIRNAEERLSASNQANAKLKQELHKAEERNQQLSSGREVQDLTKLLKEDVRRLRDLLKKVTNLDRKIGDVDMSAQLEEGKIHLAAFEEMFNRLKSTLADARHTQDVLGLVGAHAEAGAESATEAEPRAEPEAPALAVQSPTTWALEESNRMRRVTVRSPVEEPAPAAPTVSEERQNRRIAQPRKPSIRAARMASSEIKANKSTPTAEQLIPAGESEASASASQPAKDNQRPELSAHSSYNRPVRSDNKRKRTETTEATNKRRKTSQASISVPGQNRPRRAMSEYIPHGEEMPDRGASHNTHVSRDEEGEDVGVEETSPPTADDSRLGREGQRRRNLRRSTTLITYGRQASNPPDQDHPSTDRMTRRSPSQTSNASTNTMKSGASTDRLRASVPTNAKSGRASSSRRGKT
ncbi:hypothetical protein SUNI508_13675 [Seiridium unicorne]|uniref:Uncharacterized protein n=1 Tax=Seiridium unicorne TaxID=138068 RepID=A0ABR2VCR5_9PEZI